MGLPILVLGETGSGKTYSIKNFDTNEVGIFSVEKPFLPFKKDFAVQKRATYETIMSCFKRELYIVLEPEIYSDSSTSSVGFQ